MAMASEPAGDDDDYEASPTQVQQFGEERKSAEMEDIYEDIGVNDTAL